MESQVKICDFTHDLVAMLAEIEGIDDISMTTNGVLLERYAMELKKAGLHRVNISLDSLRPERFHKITRVGKLDDVLRGIEAAREGELNPIRSIWWLSAVRTMTRYRTLPC
jgi:cyclic pyranopterin phosphate synthase